MRIFRNILLSAVAAVSAASPAFAVNTLISVNNAVTQTVHAGDTFDIDLLSGHSYVCEGIPSDPATLFSWSTAVTGVGTQTVTGVDKGSLNPPLTTAIGVNTRLVFTPSISDQYRLSAVNAKASTGETVKIRCLDSSLYGDYNTTVNSFNFLELTNTTSATVTGKITATNFDGAVVINGQAFSLLANRRADFDIHTVAGTNKFGTILISSDAPFGALRGSLSEYSGSVSSFQLNATLPLKPVDVTP